jgi:flagellar biosynthesis/type III secretory pathway chaperone
MPENPLERLLINLQTARKVYERLLELAEKKRLHIVQNDLAALRRDIETEQRLAGAGASLNTERDALHRECCAALRVKARAKAPQGAAAKLEDLCAAMPREMAQRFSVERAALCRTLEQLLRANRTNAFLVNNSLDLMQGLLNALFGGEKICAYGPRGSRARTEYSVRSLDTQA